MSVAFKPHNPFGPNSCQACIIYAKVKAQETTIKKTKSKPIFDRKPSEKSVKIKNIRNRFDQIMCVGCVLIRFGVQRSPQKLIFPLHVFFHMYKIQFVALFYLWRFSH